MILTFFLKILCGINILYDYKLHNKNFQDNNMPAFDLISTEDRILIQVTSSITPEKIKSTFKGLENLTSERYNKAHTGP